MKDMANKSKLEQTKTNKEEVKEKLIDSIENNGGGIRKADISENIDGVTDCQDVMKIRLRKTNWKSKVKCSVAYNQGSILKKHKEMKGLSKMANEIGLSKSTILFEIKLYINLY